MEKEENEEVVEQALKRGSEPAPERLPRRTRSPAIDRNPNLARPCVTDAGPLSPHHPRHPPLRRLLRGNPGTTVAPHAKVGNPAVFTDACETYRLKRVLRNLERPCHQHVHEHHDAKAQHQQRQLLNPKAIFSVGRFLRHTHRVSTMNPLLKMAPRGWHTSNLSKVISGRFPSYTAACPERSRMVLFVVQYYLGRPDHKPAENVRFNSIHTPISYSPIPPITI